MPSNPDLTAKFQAKAEAVAAKVSTVANLREAMAYAADLCATKEACQLLVSGCEEALSPTADALCGIKPGARIIAAPHLPADMLAELRGLAADKGVEVIDSGLRRFVAGIDIGFTVADHGIAETGTLVMDSSSEDLRLATMLCEFHVAVLPLSTLRGTAEELAPWLEERMMKTPNYMAFVTGASRTADIERVLALGVHGPLELHILLWEDA